MRAGDKVVCVDDSPCRWCGERDRSRLNEVYVIKSTLQLTHGLRLFFVSGKHFCACPDDGSVPAYRYRLLDEMKQQAKQRNSEPATK